jgi:hypothetical protein
MKYGSFKTIWNISYKPIMIYHRLLVVSPYEVVTRLRFFRVKDELNLKLGM